MKDVNLKAKMSTLVLFVSVNMLMTCFADRAVQVTINVGVDDVVEKKAKTVVMPMMSVTNNLPKQQLQPPSPPPPPPPPEPSSVDASDPRRLVRYFCRMWKDEDYERMYWTMTPRYRKSVTLEKFTNLFTSDAERTGGLKDENIIVDDVDEGKFYFVTVDLRFNFVRAKDRRVKAVLEKGKKGYRIKDSGILPVDLDSL